MPGAKFAVGVDHLPLRELVLRVRRQTRVDDALDGRMRLEELAPPSAPSPAGGACGRAASAGRASGRATRTWGRAARRSPSGRGGRPGRSAPRRSRRRPCRCRSRRCSSSGCGRRRPRRARAGAARTASRTCCRRRRRCAASRRGASRSPRFTIVGDRLDVDELERRVHRRLEVDDHRVHRARSRCSSASRSCRSTKSTSMPQARVPVREERVRAAVERGVGDDPVARLASATPSAPLIARHPGGEADAAIRRPRPAARFSSSMPRAGSSRRS